MFRGGRGGRDGGRGGRSPGGRGGEGCLGRWEMCIKRATQDVTAAEVVAEEVVVVEAAVVAEEGEVEGESFYLGITVRLKVYGG